MRTTFARLAAALPVLVLGLSLVTVGAAGAGGPPLDPVHPAGTSAQDAAPADPDEPDEPAAVNGVTTLTGEANEEAAEHWTPERMREATPLDLTIDAPEYQGVRADVPDIAPGLPAPRPYNPRVAYNGRIFMDTPAGPNSCSGTVVGSATGNLIWTAAHCLHGGPGQGYYSNFVFVPAYDGQRTGPLPGAPNAFAPYGIWPFKAAVVTRGWASDGLRTGVGVFTDYGALTVFPQGGKNLQEVAGSVPIAFYVPYQLPINAVGYPVMPPYDGMSMISCDAPSSMPSTNRFPTPPRTNPMHWIGCTQTEGFSGGGWFINFYGVTHLVSVTSAHLEASQGPYNTSDAQYMWFGPFLSDGATEMYDLMVYGAPLRPPPR